MNMSKEGSMQQKAIKWDITSELAPKFPQNIRCNNFGETCDMRRRAFVTLPTKYFLVSWDKILVEHVCSVFPKYLASWILAQSVWSPQSKWQNVIYKIILKLSLCYYVTFLPLEWVNHLPYIKRVKTWNCWESNWYEFSGSDTFP